VLRIVIGDTRHAWLQGVKSLLVEVEGRRGRRLHFGDLSSFHTFTSPQLH
jgi:hypothetical protein